MKIADSNAWGLRTQVWPVLLWRESTWWQAWKEKLPDDWLSAFPFHETWTHTLLHILGLLFLGASRRTLIHHFSLKSWTQGTGEQAYWATHDSASYFTLLNKKSSAKRQRSIRCTASQEEGPSVTCSLHLHVHDPAELNTIVFFSSPLYLAHGCLLIKIKPKPHVFHETFGDHSCFWVPSASRPL